MEDKKHGIPTSLYIPDRRSRLAKLNVLIADRDRRIASLVQRVLLSFGFRNMDVAESGEDALYALRTRRYDILITEWNMEPVDGLAIVRAIRAAKDDARMPRNIPIIMLTARADFDSVQVARDAGITEFVAKPFSAKTISDRIIQVIDNPRLFVECRAYVGPDRRRRGKPPPGEGERRGRAKKEEKKRETDAVKMLPANTSLKERIGHVTAAEILTEMVVAEAQLDLMRVENDFLEWAKDDIAQLELAFQQLRENPEHIPTLQTLRNVAYAIKSQAGIFGYALGTEVAASMVDYLAKHEQMTPEHLIVIGKHIDTISLIFRERIKESGQNIASDMIQSLKMLIEKLG